MSFFSRKTDKKKETVKKKWQAELSSDSDSEEGDLKKKKKRAKSDSEDDEKDERTKRKEKPAKKNSTSETGGESESEESGSESSKQKKKRRKSDSDIEDDDKQKKKGKVESTGKPNVQSSVKKAKKSEEDAPDDISCATCGHEPEVYCLDCVKYFCLSHFVTKHQLLEGEVDEEAELAAELAAARARQDEAEAAEAQEEAGPLVASENGVNERLSSSTSSASAGNIPTAAAYSLAHKNRGEVHEFRALAGTPAFRLEELDCGHIQGKDISQQEDARRKRSVARKRLMEEEGMRQMRERIKAEREQEEEEERARQAALAVAAAPKLPPPVSPLPEPVVEFPIKTRMCRHFLQSGPGNSGCYRGNNCSFAHHPRELAPSFRGAAAQAQVLLTAKQASSSLAKKPTPDLHTGFEESTAAEEQKIRAEQTRIEEERIKALQEAQMKQAREAEAREEYVRKLAARRREEEEAIAREKRRREEEEEQWRLEQRRKEEEIYRRREDDRRASGREDERHHRSSREASYASRDEYPAPSRGEYPPSSRGEYPAYDYSHLPDPRAYEDQVRYMSSYPPPPPPRWPNSYPPSYPERPFYNDSRGYPDAGPSYPYPPPPPPDHRNSSYDR